MREAGNVGGFVAIFGYRVLCVTIDLRFYDSKKIFFGITSRIQFVSKSLKRWKDQELC